MSTFGFGGDLEAADEDLEVSDARLLPVDWFACEELLEPEELSESPDEPDPDSPKVPLDEFELVPVDCDVVDVPAPDAFCAAEGAEVEGAEVEAIAVDEFAETV